MTITEKAAYLKGLAEGMGLENDEKYGKFFSAVIDLLKDIADEVDEVECDVEELGEGLDALSDDLSDVEDEVFGEEEDECDCCDCCDCDDEYDEEVSVTCPKCNTEFIVSDEDLENGEVECPECGEHLEFEFDDCDCCEDDN